MKLDDENQRQQLLSLIAHATFQGRSVDEVYALKKAVTEAPIEENCERPSRDT